MLGRRSKETILVKIVTKQGSLHHRKFSKVHTGFDIPYAHDYVTKLCRRQAEVIQNHENEHVRSIGQGEASHRKYERLKFGGGQAYDRSSD
jgi:hypothetical protein